MEAMIDREGCIGCGICPSVCPEVFRMADDGRAEVYGNVNETTKPVADKAADECPVSVISVL